MHKLLILQQMVLASRDLDLSAYPEVRQCLADAEALLFRSNADEQEITDMIHSLSDHLKQVRRVLN